MFTITLSAGGIFTLGAITGVIICLVGLVIGATAGNSKK